MSMYIKDFPSSAAREFAARISKAPVEVRVRLRREYETLCSRSGSYKSDLYDHRSETHSLDRMDPELKRLGL